MSILDLIILAFVEGVAEVLPIDASGHALLASKLLGFRGGSILVAIHFGSALAILAYLWRDVLSIGQGLWRLGRGRVEPGLSLLLKVMVASLPWLAAQILLFGSPHPAELSDLLMVGITTLVCALIMGVADQLCMTVKRIEHLSWLGALLLGLFQLLALVPGVGRLAVEATVARMLGLERPAVYRFVLLCSVPGLLLAGVQGVLYYSRQGVAPQAADVLGAGITFLLVLAAMALAMAWMRRSGLLIFTLYRLALGGALVFYAVA